MVSVHETAWTEIDKVDKSICDLQKEFEKLESFLDSMRIPARKLKKASSFLELARLELREL